MGRMSRRKGRKFEQVVATLYRERWPRATVRRALQAHRPHEPDVVVEGDAPAVARALWTECCHSKSETVEGKHAQAVRDIERAKAAGKMLYAIPVVMFKRDGEAGWRAALTVAALLYVLGVCEMGEAAEVRGAASIVQLPVASFLALLPDAEGA